MSAGVPCIASIHAGATHDVIKDGTTGFTMDFSEIEKEVDKIEWILDNHEAAAHIGHNAIRFIEENVSLGNQQLVLSLQSRWL
jgi:glycosyltransferase involved in cell wall biosynthesis